MACHGQGQRCRRSTAFLPTSSEPMEAQGWLIKVQPAAPSVEQFWKALAVLASRSKESCSPTSRAKIKGLLKQPEGRLPSRGRLPLPPCQGDAEPTAADPQADQVEVKAAGIKAFGGLQMPRAHHGHARGVVCLQKLETQHY